VRCGRGSQKSITKIPYFRSSGSFKVIDVDTTKKLVTSVVGPRYVKRNDIQQTQVVNSIAAAQQQLSISHSLLCRWGIKTSLF